VVGDEEDGYDSDSGYCTRSDIGVPAAVKRLCHGSRRGSSGMEFWIFHHADGRLSGTGDSGDSGWIRAGLFREVL